MATATAPKWRTIAGWAAAGAVVWVTAGAVDRQTRLDIFSDGGRLLVAAAGSELVAEVAVDSVERYFNIDPVADCDPEAADFHGLDLDADLRLQANDASWQIWARVRIDGAFQARLAPNH